MYKDEIVQLKRTVPYMFFYGISGGLYSLLWCMGIVILNYVMLVWMHKGMDYLVLGNN